MKHSRRRWESRREYCVIYYTWSAESECDLFVINCINYSLPEHVWWFHYAHVNNWSARDESSSPAPLYNVWCGCRRRSIIPPSTYYIYALFKATSLPRTMHIQLLPPPPSCVFSKELVVLFHGVSIVILIRCRIICRLKLHFVHTYTHTWYLADNAIHWVDHHVYAAIWSENIAGNPTTEFLKSRYVMEVANSCYLLYKSNCSL